jgi:hypothetical protein
VCSIECESVQYWNLKFEINFNIVLNVLKERNRWNIKPRIPKYLCKKISKGTNKDWPNICQVSVIIPVFNIFMSRKAGVLLFSTKKEEPGNEVVICVASANYYNRLIYYGWFEFERVHFFRDTLHVVIMFYIKT